LGLLICLALIVCLPAVGQAGLEVTWGPKWEVTFGRDPNENSPYEYNKQAFGEGAQDDKEVSHPENKPLVARSTSTVKGQPAEKFEAWSTVNARRNVKISGAPKEGCNWQLNGWRMGPTGREEGAAITGTLSIGNPFFQPYAYYEFTYEIYEIPDMSYAGDLKDLPKAAELPPMSKPLKADGQPVWPMPVTPELVHRSEPVNEAIDWKTPLKDGTYATVAELKTYASIQSLDSVITSDFLGGRFAGWKARNAFEMFLWEQMELGNTPDGFDPDLFIDVSAGFAEADLWQTVQLDFSVEPIPEPAALSILVLGGLAALTRRRR